MAPVLTEPRTDDFVKALTSAPIAAPATPTILIADDDDEIRDVIAFKLQVSGFRTLSADNGRTALSLAVERQPRMIILDVTLPMDGLSVCHELHARRETARIPVLMINGTARPGDLGLGFAVDADNYLPRPFSQQEMLRRVNCLLMSRP